MGWQLSMILADRLLDEEEKLSLAKKYYRSYSKQEVVTLDTVIYPRGEDFYIGEHNGSTIITNYKIPDTINYYATQSGKFGQKHPTVSKLVNTLNDCNVFCVYFNSVGTFFSYSYFSDGVRTRYKQNLIDDDPELSEEVGNLLPEEEEFYAYSTIHKIVPGDKLNYEGNIGIIHRSVYNSRTYYDQKRIESENGLGEYQCGFEVIRKVSQRFLGKPFDALHLDKLKMTRYGK